MFYTTYRNILIYSYIQRQLVVFILHPMTYNNRYAYFSSPLYRNLAGDRRVLVEFSKLWRSLDENSWGRFSTEYQILLIHYF